MERMNKISIGSIRNSLRHFALISLYVLAFGCRGSSPDIVVQDFNMLLTEGSQIATEALLEGEIADTRIRHITYAGPINQSINLSEEYANMFLFIKGNGKLQADTTYFPIVPESIAIPTSFTRITFNVSDKDTLHFLQFTKKLSAQDKEEMKSFPAENKYDIYFTKFSDCEAYTEKIKSPNTVSRTVLPADIIPRVSLGTVEAPGPDAVGAHEHSMLDQLFLGLSGNDVIVTADDKTAVFKEYSLLHIPIGSSHWVSVEKGKKMYYLWMDFFLTMEGQEWLKTHKPIGADKKD